jgi:hypothetical protein
MPFFYLNFQIECGPTNMNTDNNTTSAGTDELLTDCLKPWVIYNSSAIVSLDNTLPHIHTDSVVLIP